MTNELKTLNDIRRIGGEHLDFADVDELRQEAIRWVKHLETEYGTNPSIYGADKLLLVHRNIAIAEWIKHFFNISSEELKNDDKINITDEDLK